MANGYPAGSKRAQGDWHERRAERFLLDRGLSLITRNFQCKLGEIDLIMRTGHTLVFVEVRYRKHRHFGGAAASVTPTKQQRLRRAALSYLQAKGLNESSQSCRFDLVACDGDDINWIPNAF